MQNENLSPAVIYRKFVDGGEFSDEELAFGIEHFGKLAEMLLQSGPEFSITASACNRVTEYLKCRMWKRKGISLHE